MLATLSTINYLAVIVSAIIYMGFGFLWYSPLLIGKPWVKLMGYHKMTKEDMKKMQKEAGPAYMISMVTSLVQSFLLAWVVLPSYAAASISSAVLAVALIWLCFTFCYAITGAAFTKKPYALVAIDSGYQLFGLIIVTIILKIWA